MALKNEYDAGPQPKVKKGEFQGIGTAVPLPQGEGLTGGAIFGNYGCADPADFPEKCPKLEWNDSGTTAESEEFVRRDETQKLKGL